jgi:hypothetical protein
MMINVVRRGANVTGRVLNSTARRSDTSLSIVDEVRLRSVVMISIVCRVLNST